MGILELFWGNSGKNFLPCFGNFVAKPIVNCRAKGKLECKKKTAVGKGSEGIDHLR